MPAQDSSSPPKGKKLLDQLRDAIRAKHYSYRTEQTYVDWCKRYILYPTNDIPPRWACLKSRHSSSIWPTTKMWRLPLVEAETVDLNPVGTAEHNAKEGAQSPLRSLTTV